MANSYNGHQILADTATATPIATNWIKVRGGIWEGMLASANMTITDISGRQFTFTAYQANFPIDIGPLGWIYGCAFPVLSSGKVMLYLDR